MIRFDAQTDARIDEHDKEWPLDDVVWYLTDSHSNGRWLYVDKPTTDGLVPLAIQRVYTKRLSPKAARELAAVLVQVADEAERARREYERERNEREAARQRCLSELGGHEWPSASMGWRTQGLICKRCGSAPETVAFSYP